MKIIIAPDSFKESLTSEKACLAIEKGIRKIFPEAEIQSVPMADGGEGAVRAMVSAANGRIINLKVHDPLMRIIDSYYGILSDNETAIIEMATASGLELLEKEERNPLKTTSFGTGELIRHALDMGCKKIIIGLGGSATNDGGAGMAMALGAKLIDNNGEQIEQGGGNLDQLNHIDITSLDPRIFKTEITAACDVVNPLLGTNGATRIFGPQKGADEVMILLLEKNLSHWSNLILRDLKISVSEIPGSGAAGGLGAGLMAFLNAKLKPGFEIISKTLKLEELIKNADLILTAEGKTDKQTLSGKVPFGVAELGKKYNVPVILFTGQIEQGAEKLYERGINSIVCISSGPMSLSESIAKVEYLLENSAERTFRLLKINNKN